MAPKVVPDSAAVKVEAVEGQAQAVAGRGPADRVVEEVVVAKDAAAVAMGNNSAQPTARTSSS